MDRNLLDSLFPFLFGDFFVYFFFRTGAQIVLFHEDEAVNNGKHSIGGGKARQVKVRAE